MGKVIAAIGIIIIVIIFLLPVYANQATLPINASADDVGLYFADVLNYWRQVFNTFMEGFQTGV